MSITSTMSLFFNQAGNFVQGPFTQSFTSKMEFFTPLHLCRTFYHFFFNHFSFFENETPAKVFSCECCEVFENRLFIEHPWLLLLPLLPHVIHEKVTNYGMAGRNFLQLHLAALANHALAKQVEQVRNHNFNYCSHFFLQIGTPIVKKTIQAYKNLFKD